MSSYIPGDLGAPEAEPQAPRARLSHLEVSPAGSSRTRAINHGVPGKTSWTHGPHNGRSSARIRSLRSENMQRGTLIIAEYPWVQRQRSGVDARTLGPLPDSQLQRIPVSLPSDQRLQRARQRSSDAPGWKQTAHARVRGANPSERSPAQFSPASELPTTILARHIPTAHCGDKTSSPTRPRNYPSHFPSAREASVHLQAMQTHGCPTSKPIAFRYRNLALRYCNSSPDRYRNPELCPS